MRRGRVRGLVHGGVAWVIGYGVTLVLVLVGLVDRPGGAFRAAADAYIAAHTLPVAGEGPAFVVAVPILVIGFAGYRAGRALRTGITGRLRALVQSLMRAERYRLWQAVTAAVLLGAGYTLAAAIVALLVGAALSGVIVAALLASLIIGVPTAIVGAFR